MAIAPIIWGKLGLRIGVFGFMFYFVNKIVYSTIIGYN